MNFKPLPFSFVTRLLICAGFSLGISFPANAQVDCVVVFNEIHYHPASEDPDTEFVEFFNQYSVNVDLSGWKLEGAGGFVFPQGTTIEGRSYLVVAKDPQALPDVEALGGFEGALSNAGETLTLRNHNGRIMDQIDFGDRHPWPLSADGSGATLSKRNPFTSSREAWHWSASASVGGTPGRANELRASSGVRFSEVPAWIADEGETWVEIFNTGPETIDLSALVLTTRLGQTQNGVGLLEPQAYSQWPLELEAAEGECLFLIDTANSLVWDAVELKDHGQARVDFSNSRFFFPVEESPGAPNQVTFDDRIVINEIMYHRRPEYEDPDDPDSAYRESDEEWVELFNRSDVAVDLSGWKLRGGVRFEFPEATVLQAGSYLVVARDANSLTEAVPDIDILGDWSGSLRNGGDELELRDAVGNPVDWVRFADDSPWPAEADGGGSSLELRHPDMDNRRPEAWAASDESLRSEWHTYSYRAVAERPVYTANVRNFHELRLGFIQAGRCLVDDVSVIEDPDGARDEIMRNRVFGSLFAPVSSSNWRLVGNHDQSEAIMDPEAGAVLKIVAESSMNYLNNLCEGGLSKEVEIGKEYEVSFKAKWLGGSPQLRSEVYYNKFAKKHILIMPERHGTPGRQNTALVDNGGPTYQALSHHPVVPSPADNVRISVEATDSDGIDQLELFYSVDEGEWQSMLMDPTDDHGSYEAVLPPQARDDVVQFYVSGRDQLGAESWYPADGPESGAFYRVDTPVDPERRQSMRLITRGSDAAELHDSLLYLSNRRRDCTVILNEQEIVYGCGVRQRGSMFSRNGAGAGLNIKFPGDQPFRGSQPTVIIRWRNPQEILVKHMANHAGGIPASYNDFYELRGYRSGQRGLIRLEAARFGENWVKGAFEDGDTEGVFKMEGIRDFQQAGAGGIKRPMPIGWIVQYDFADLGDDKEQYRHVLRMISARRKDDYTPMIDLSKAFSAPDDELREAVEAVIDVDQWARMMAVQTLCGIADVYPVENPHNFNLYRRPTDLKVIAIPWDWDFTFNLTATSRIMDPRSSRKNLWRILDQPGIQRLYRGHLLDVIDRIFNEAYAQEWFSHYADVGSTNYNGHVTYVRSRASSVKVQASSVVPFAITTEDGADFSVDQPEVTLRGRAGVRVRHLEHVESGIWYEPYWIDDEQWEISLPLESESQTITLQARDYRGTKGSLFAPAGKDAITITNTSTEDAPSAENLIVSEIMYHPAEPSTEEQDAGFDDQDLFEFIELVNVGDRPLAMRSLSFSGGISFDFGEKVLGAGELALLVADEAAFSKRYGEGFPVWGTYTGNLANGGERLELTAGSGRVIQAFRFDDGSAWPQEADGEGRSLELTPLSGPIEEDSSERWAASQEMGGTPGSLPVEVEKLSYDEWAATALAEGMDTDPNADPDGDGLVNLLEFALGTRAGTTDSGSPIVISQEGERIHVHHRRNPSADAKVVLEVSSDLQTWKTLSAEDILDEQVQSSEAIERVQTTLARAPQQTYLRIRVQLGD